MSRAKDSSGRRGRAALLGALAGFVASAAALEVELTRLDGTTVRGVLRTAIPQLELELGTEEAPAFITLKWEDLLSLRTIGGGAEGASPAAWHFELSDGSRFGAVITAQAGAEVLLQTTYADGIRVPLTALRSVRHPVASATANAKFDELRTARDDHAAATPKDDQAVVAKDDGALVLAGRITGISAERVEFQWNGRSVPLPWPRVAGLLAAEPQPRSAPMAITTRGGATFCGLVSGGDTTQLSVRSGIFADVPIPWDDIAQIEVRSPRVVYLSQLAPRTYEHDPLFNIHWSYGRDAAINGGPVVLNGQTYARAIVLHATSRIVFALGGDATQFAATVGVLDAYPHGNADVAIVGDGQVLWEQRGIRAGASESVSIDVRGVRNLELAVNRGADLDLGDHVAFAAARVIRGSAE